MHDHTHDPEIDSQINQLFGQAAHPSQMAAMAQAMIDPWEGLPIAPEACRWDCNLATRPACEVPELDDEGNLVFDEDGKPITVTQPAHHLAIIRLVAPNHASKVWFDRETIAKFQEFLKRVDELLLEQETGIKTQRKPGLIIPGQ